MPLSASKSTGTHKLADKPTNFQAGKYLLIPSVSSESRHYIPIGFMNPDDLDGNLVFVVPNATLYHFGILTSSIHMTWLRTVGERLEARYRYSKNVVYNNFIWCKPSTAQQNAIEQSTQRILDVQANYTKNTFTELYDEISIPYDLRDAYKKMTALLSLLFFSSTKNFLPKKIFQHKRIFSSCGELLQKCL